MTESLTTDLSRIDGSFVIARNTAFAYKGKHVDVKQIGRELNVRYVLEGSVQRAGAPDARQCPAHRRRERHPSLGGAVRQAVADLFDMQDEIVARLANALERQLFAAEARRAERTPNPEFDGPLLSGLGLAEQGLHA